MVVDKIRQANRKWKHEQRRKHKRYDEKQRALEERLKKSQRRKAELAYVQSLKDEAEL